MKETETIKEWMSWFESRLEETTGKLWSYKIPDNRYTGKKPFDVVGAYRYVKLGQMVSCPLALEFKLHKELTPFNFSRVIDFQVKSMEDFHECGGDARLVLAIKFMLSEEEKFKFNYPTRRVNIWIWWPILEFIKYKNEHKSLNVRELLMKGVTGYVDWRIL